jgi:predicted 2-oxoglutarate/Fe(II)-dependent dioxygenase YbiX
VPTADFFARLGLFVIKGFLDPETCARLRTEAGAAEKVPGAVGGEGSEYRVDVRSRSTGIATVSSEAEALVARPLSAAIPDMARHFSVEVEGRQSLQFLVYGEGDFFEPHRDRNDSEEAAAFSKRRRVSVVIFLNGEGETPSEDGYGGGALTFYELLSGERGEQVGYSGPCKTGDDGLHCA